MSAGTHQGDGRKRLRLASLWLAAALALPACSADVDVIADCEGDARLEPICGFQHPEDLAAVPRSSWLVVSEMAWGEASGALVGFRRMDGRRRVLYPEGPDAGLLSSAEPRPGWGDPACPGPPDPTRFEPHGIAIRSDPAGAGVVAVVHHGSRESVELFEVGSAAGGPALGWRGCVPMPEGVWPNDVAFFPDGGFAVTHMMAPSEDGISPWDGLRLALGADTGAVYRWHPDTGLEAVPESQGSGPNGVAVSMDGTEIFFAEWGGERLVRLRLDGAPVRQSVGLGLRPDNLSWARDGRLLVAGQRGRLGDVVACTRIERGRTCAMAWSVLAVDPATLEVETLLEGEGEVTGAVASALHVGGELFLGTFAGDRIVRTRFPRP